MGTGSMLELINGGKDIFIKTLILSTFYFQGRSMLNIMTETSILTLMTVKIVSLTRSQLSPTTTLKLRTMKMQTVTSRISKILIQLKLMLLLKLLQLLKPQQLLQLLQQLKLMQQKKCLLVTTSTARILIKISSTDQPSEDMIRKYRIQVFQYRIIRELL